MPTLAEKGKFSFNEKAGNNVTPQMKTWLDNDTAIDIIIKVLEMKLLNTGKQNRLYFLRGRTGSGKSTYMIQELYKRIIMMSDCGTSIFCTQPRVVLTKSNPTELIRYNKEWAFGQNIGVRNGSEKIQTTSKYNIIYCTTQIMGNLLVELMSMTDKDKQIKIMSQMKIVVIDECHVLDSPMMALLKTVYDVVEKFGNWKECPLFIFSSATIDINNMVKYYFPPYRVKMPTTEGNVVRRSSDDNVKRIVYPEVMEDPLLIGDVQGSPNFPVEELYISSSELKKLNEQEKKLATREAGFELLAKYFIDHYLQMLFESKSTITYKDETVKCRDALLFVPLFSAIGFIGDKIEEGIKKFNKPFFKIGKDCQWSEVEKWRNMNRNKERVIYVGYGRNYAPASEQILSSAVEQDPEARQNEIKIICSTSVIETGKTIATLYLCLNMGIETTSLYNPLTYKPENSLQYLKQVPINKNQCIQRKGRVGRECPGVFVHFYSKNCFDKFRNIDIAETINNSYLSALLLNDLSQFEIGVYRDVFNLNNYYYPTSTDILINSARDLINAGYLTPFGQFVALNNSVQHSENWVIYAKYLFYCLGWSLWDALLLSSINRKNLPPMLTLYNIRPTSLRLQLKDIDENTINDDIIESIQRAKNTMTSILYGNDELFKSTEERIYKSIFINDGTDNILNERKDEKPIRGRGLIKNNAFDSWYMLNEVGRL